MHATKGHKNRSEFEIVNALLEVMETGNYSVTQLVQKCNLFFPKIHERVNKLMGLQLIERYYDTDSWMTTKKGKVFMESIKEFVDYK